MDRSKMFAAVTARTEPWDLVVIGGGATGVGTALDAASRGFDVLLLEQSDFGKGTSSRSTKLVHGGVRYLKQGNLSLVREALRERRTMRDISPGSVARQRFIVPCYSRIEQFYYGLGLKFYDRLSGKFSFGKSRFLSRREVMESLPGIKSRGLRGGVEYFDGRFDDARFLIRLARAAAGEGAVLLNYAKVTGFKKDDRSKIGGVTFEDAESGSGHTVSAKVVVNATGIFCDEVRRKADPTAEGLATLSRGTHLVFKSEFLSGESALMIPKTADGRVLFAIPWHGRLLVGTTDLPVEEARLEPKAAPEEIDFIIETLRGYVLDPPTRTDVLSVFSGIRPLVGEGNSNRTSGISRRHKIEVSDDGLVTVAGGKWTTYRQMAEDAVDAAVRTAGLPSGKCETSSLTIRNDRQDEIDRMIANEIGLGEKIVPGFEYTKADVVYAIRFEMARTLEDVLSRRTRLLVLDAAAALEAAPGVAGIIADELGWGATEIESQIAAFREIARNYSVSGE